MSVVTLRPNGTRPPSAATTTGAANPHTALSDGTYGSPETSSYITLPKSTGLQYFDLTTTTKPAGSRVKSVQPWFWLASDTTEYARFNYRVYIASDAWAASQGHIVNDTTFRQRPGMIQGKGDLTQAQIDAMLLAFAVPTASAADARVAEAGVNITFQHAPTTTITSAGGTISESEYELTWTHTPGSDGGGQVAYRVRVFTAEQYTAAGFDAASSPAMFDSGVRLGSAGAFLIGGLSPGSYRVAVRSAQPYLGGLHHFAAAYDTEDITVDVDASEVDTVSAVIDDSTGLVTVTVDRDTGSDAWDHIELQRSANVDLLDGVGMMASGSSSMATGWQQSLAGSAPSGWATSRSATGGPDNGPYLQYTGTIGSSVSGVEVVALSPVRPDTDYTVQLALSYSHGHATNQFTFVRVLWYDAGGNYISVGGAAYQGSGTGSFVNRTASARSPANARFARVLVATWANVSSYVATVRVAQARLLRYEDAWVPVRGADQLTPGTNQVVALDWETPPHRAVVYRARAVDANGLLGDWVYSVAVEWSIEKGIWIKSIEDPARNIQLRLFSPPTPSYPGRRSIHWPAGASKPVSTSDVRGGRTIRFGVRTVDETERQAVLALLSDDVWLIQVAEGVNFEPGYYVIGDVTESHLTRYGAFPYRDWEVDAVEVQTP